MSSTGEIAFIDTMEYRRFLEFCDACRQYRYIGLCYGPPGVGKTLSARRYSNWDKVEPYKRFMSLSGVKLRDILRSNVVFYTAPVVNTPKSVEQDIGDWRIVLRSFLIEDLHREKNRLYDAIKKEEECEEKAILARHDYQRFHLRDLAEKMNNSRRECGIGINLREKAIKDPTALIIIDEADRLKMASLEQVRSIYDNGGVGIVLIGMTGLEKRLARYPQLYSRVGFVHEYRPLSRKEMRQLIEDRWCPSGVLLPENGMTDEDGVATIIRVTNGNFRLLNRLLTQIGRVLEINRLDQVTREVVEAARESLVIGTA